MTIKVGDRMPSGTMHTMTENGPAPVSTDELFKGKKVVLFSVPGAFTPTCSTKHLPGFVKNAEAIKGKGVDEIACVAVNDAFVMGAWNKDQKTDGKVTMLADGSADYSKKLGLEADFTGYGMGIRGKRFSLLVDDGVVKAVNVDEGEVKATSAETKLDQLV